MMVGTALGSPERYPALGFDPVPGAPERVSSLAADLTSVAIELHAAEQALTRIGTRNGLWQGEAAQAFQHKLGELPDYLKAAYHSLGDAAATLEQWSRDLTSLRKTAEQYEIEAEQALQRWQAAESNPDLSLVGQRFSAEDSTRAQARYAAATAQLESASQELEAIRSLARACLPSTKSWRARQQTRCAEPPTKLRRSPAGSTRSSAPSPVGLRGSPPRCGSGSRTTQI